MYPRLTHRAVAPQIALLAAVLANFLSALPATAHPSSGIAVDSVGNVYFSDLSRGLWKIDTRGKLTLLHKEGFHWISLDAKGAFSRADYTVGPFRWFQRRTPSGQIPAVLTASDSPLTGGPDGALYYAVDDERANPGVLQVARLTSDGKKTLLNPQLRRISNEWGGIADLAAGADGSLYVSYAKAIFRISPQGNITPIAAPAVVGDCEQTPPSTLTSPTLRGLAVNTDGTVYVAATGCRRVISIGPNGKTTVVLRSEAPWSPSGVALHAGSVYVLEQVNANSEGHETWPPRVRKLNPDGSVSTLADLRK